MTQVGEENVKKEFEKKLEREIEKQLEKKLEDELKRNEKKLEREVEEQLKRNEKKLEREIEKQLEKKLEEELEEKLGKKVEKGIENTFINYAIVEASGRQFWVQNFKCYDFNSLSSMNTGREFCFTNIILRRGGISNNTEKYPSLKVGSPYLDFWYYPNQIRGHVVKHFLGSKIRVYKMKAKKKTRKTFGSRPKLTRVKISKL